MDGYKLIMLLQKKMKDPKFEAKFNRLADDFSRIPGLQQQVMKIAQIEDEKKRLGCIEKLPEDAKKVVKEVLELLRE